MALKLKRRKIFKYLFNRRKKKEDWLLPVARLCDVGRSFVTVVLLVVTDARDAPVIDDVCVEPLVVPLDAVFVGGFVDACGGRVLALDAVGTVDDEAVPSGAVESVVVCWSDGVVEGRVGFVTGLVVDRDVAVVVVVDDAAAVVELGAGFGLVVVDGGLVGTSR